MSDNRTLNNEQIARAAMIVLLGFLASGALGLVRTAVVASAFGTNNQTEAYYSAQRVPEALFVLVAGGALGSAFIPVFSRFLGRNREKAWRLASATMTLSAGAAFVLSVIAMIAAPLYIGLLVPANSGEGVQELSVGLLRLMLITPVIFSISGLVMGILNAHQLFTLPALAIGMKNVGEIIGALVFAEMLPGSPNIYGLALGSVLGALLHLAVQIPGLNGIGGQLRPVFDLNTDGVREVLLLMGPRVLGLGVVQINFMVNVRLANPMVEGSVTVMNYAWSLMFFALGIIAQSVGTALFPTLSALAADGNMDGFRARLSNAMRSILFLALPVTFGLILMGEPLISLIAERDMWDRSDTIATAWALSFFAVGIAGHGLLEVLARAFYALSDTWTPVWVGVLALVSNIVLSLTFIQFIGEPGNFERGPFAGLALANSVTTLVEAVVLWVIMHRRIGGVREGYVFDGIWRTAVAALLMTGAVYGMDRSFGEALAPLLRLLIVGGTGAAIFFALAALLRLNEVIVVYRMMLRRLGLKRAPAA